MKFVTWLRMCAAIAFVCLLAPVAHAQQACATSGGSGYTLITATHIGGQLSPTPSATLYVQPMSGLTSGLGAARVGTAGGQALSVPYAATVTAGAANCGVPDALLTNPGICYAITVIDSSQTAIIGAGLAPDGVHVQSGGPYGCAQPNGTTWSLDSYVPSMPVSVLPTSLFDSPGTTTGAPGTLAAASVSTVGPGQYHLSFTIPTGAAGPNCNVASPPGHCDLGATQLDAASVSNATQFQAADPPGGAATALQDATQHYVDTSMILNLKAFGCDPANTDNSPCFDTMAKNLSFNSYYLPPGNYNVASCTPFQQLASHFDIHGAAWAASNITYTGTASTTTPTNTTGWWTSGSTSINSTAQPHVGDSVLAYQTLANLTLIAGIQTGTTVTSVSGTGPYTVGISKATTAAAGTSGSPVPLDFGWQCIFDLGADDINWFSIHDLGFAYTNLPQAATSSTTDYPATAILFNTSGLALNGIHDFNLYNLYFSGGSRGIANTRATIGTFGSFVWGGAFTNIVGAAGIATGTIPNLQGTTASGMQGATINIGYNVGKGGGSTRLTFRQIYSRQTAMEPVMTVERTAGLVLHNIESNNAQDVAYAFDNNTDMGGNGAHIEFHTQITSGHPVVQMFSSSGQFNNVDIESHICPSTLPAGNCNTTPAVPLMYGLNDNGLGVGTLSVDNWSLIPYTDSLGYCAVNGTWSAGITALTLTANSCSASIASGQYVTGQGIQAGTVITVSAGPTYALSLPPTASGSSTALVFSTYAAYVASVGTGAVAPGSSIRGTRGFNAPLVPGDGSNNLLLSAGNLFHSNPGFVVNEAASLTAPPSFVYPSVWSLGTGSTTGIPAGNECTMYLKYAGTGTFPASQYREQALCHDSGAGGLTGFGVYESDTSVRGAESFVKTFGCDKLGNCAATASMKATVIQSTGTQNLSGCGLTTNVGGSSAGKFASGTTGTCTVIITPGLTATNGYYCSAYDQTTTANAIKVTGSGTTFCTISGTTTTGDVIVWHAVAF